jgi:hypothetical protein
VGKMKKTITICLVCFFIGAAGISTCAVTSLDNPPNIPSDPHPTDGAIDIGIKTHLSWIGGDPDPGNKVVYDLYFGISSEPELLETDLQMPNYYPGILKKNTKYYWKVIARDENQIEISGPIWNFTTNDCDCDPPEKPEGLNRIVNRYRYQYTTKIMNIHQNHRGIYYQFSWGDGNYSEWIMGFSNNSGRVRAEHQWIEQGIYQVQARARFQNNSPNFSYGMDKWVYTGWSEPLIVTVKTTENNAPLVPKINGPTSGKAGVEYPYTISTTDLDGDDVFYCIDWGDGTDELCIGPYTSGQEVSITHTWIEVNKYIMRVKAKDEYRAESDWAIFEVIMPKNKAISKPFFLQSLFHRFPFFEKILNQIII